RAGWGSEALVVLHLRVGHAAWRYGAQACVGSRGALDGRALPKVFEGATAGMASASAYHECQMRGKRDYLPD
ncbi:hypothetical protein B0H13DRAFT_2032663, partial [Mycena leptocephala]